jgi:hypothetical protein
MNVTTHFILYHAQYVEAYIICLCRGNGDAENLMRAVVTSNVF